MRADALGLFWEDLPKVKTRNPRSARELGPMPEIPETNWVTPDSYPNLSAARIIGYDVETWDPELLTAGPGWGRNEGHLIGASISVEDGTSWYFPMRHKTKPEQNLDPDNVLQYLQYALGTDVPKTGANLLYDFGWLAHEGVHVGGIQYDVQFAEALLNSEVPRVDLDSLAEKYLGVGKVTSELYQWLADWCGGKPNEKQRQHLHLSPPCLAGPYAEADAALPIDILKHQWPLLQSRGVSDVFLMECKLIPLLVKMRLKGAPVDVLRAEQMYEELTKDLEGIAKNLEYIAGVEVNPNAGQSIGRAFDRLGIPVPMKVNDKGEKVPTFAADKLEAIDHPLTNTILEYRRTAKVQNTFVKGYIMDKHVNGYVHCSFHPLKGAGGGTRSGRLSSSDPNLQNIPVRTDLGKRVRGLFRGDIVGGLWRKWDYSQIEYRMLAHHAVGAGSAELRAIFNNDPNTDYHEHTIALVDSKTGIKMDRRPAKTINFGLIYGMSEKKLEVSLGLAQAKAKELFKAYHEAAPFAGETMAECAKEIDLYGYVETILGRKSDFPFWGPKSYDEEARKKLYTYDQASRKWGPYNIERNFKHKGLNRKLQGGAADVMKKAMLSAYEAGLFADDACGIPALTVHDELDFVDMGDPSRECWKEFQHVMENAIPELSVPVIIDGSMGADWGSAD